jgi:hypothetical protein
MGVRIEWATLADTRAELHAPGEARDDHGNTNDAPALFAGDGVVIEGTAEQWLTFALELVDEARDWIESDKGKGAPRPLAQLIKDVRDTLAARTAQMESEDDVPMGDMLDAVYAVQDAAAALVDALDPEGVRS